MENRNIGCIDIAKSFKALMTIANFSGFINQEDGEIFRQYDISSITGNKENATMLIDFAGHGFRLDICYDPDYTEGRKYDE